MAPGGVGVEAAPVAEGFDAPLLAEDCLETEIPLKQRDNSAAARLVKLTSADMPPELLLLRQTARSPPRIQAVLTNGLESGPGRRNKKGKGR